MTTNNFNLITDRQPTEADGDHDGHVAMQRRPDSGAYDVTFVHWSYVPATVPWRHSVFWKPQPKRTLPGIKGQWIDGASMMPTEADGDSDGDVQTLEGSYGRVRCWSNVNPGATWRPFTNADKRPLELAGACAAHARRR